jgi:tRNA(fMet)-specific endonuclease VapC
MFLLDTDHLGVIQRQAEPGFSRLQARIASHPPDVFFVSIISFHEQVAGWNVYLNRAKSSEGVVRGYRMFERILQDFASARVASFDDNAAKFFEQLRAQRIRVGTMDLRIAAIAMANDLTILSRNLSDFQRIPSLRAEDWTG